MVPLAAVAAQQREIEGLRNSLVQMQATAEAPPTPPNPPPSPAPAAVLAPALDQSVEVAAPTVAAATAAPHDDATIDSRWGCLCLYAVPQMPLMHVCEKQAVLPHVALASWLASDLSGMNGTAILGQR